MARNERLVALDVLRGLAVAGMVLVVSPGDWGQAYPQLQHASWNGATLADMVFPTFLFSVGLALGLSFPRRMEMASEQRLFWTRLFRRTVLLILLGLFVEATYVWRSRQALPIPAAQGSRTSASRASSRGLACAMVSLASYSSAPPGMIPTA